MMVAGQNLSSKVRVRLEAWSESCNFDHLIVPGLGINVQVLKKGGYDHASKREWNKI